MNKKLLSILVFSVLGIAMVSAGYYVIFSTTFTVAPSIVVEGDLDQELGEIFSGELIEGDEIIICNEAPSDRTISFTEETECDIETSYTSEVDMNKKDSEWVIINGSTVVLSYTVVGDEMKYKVDTELTDYVVVYYPDIDGNPGSWNIENAELVGDANTEWTSSDIGYLPDEADWNDRAKLWLIPSDDWDSQSWNPTEWYFENNLIAYDETVTIDSESCITIIPLYDVGAHEEGTCTIETTVA